MHTRTMLITLVALLAITVAWPGDATAKGPPIKVEQAIPSEAAQGQQGLPVKIKGRNFGPDAVVRFLVGGSDDDSQIDVVEVVYDEETGDLDTVINVSGSASIASYDIEVLRGGRGGKGTDLFSVRQSGATIETYDVTYEFGSLTGDLCIAPNCVTTTVTATGTLECGQNYCLFHATSVSDPVPLFHLPPGLRDLLLATEWRGTSLDPDQCFGSSAADPEGGTADIAGNDPLLELRGYFDEDTPWFAQVYAVALDTEGLEPRNYTFNFQGCGETSCGVFGPDSVAGDYLGGKLIRIDGKGPDRHFLSVPCRCTMSNRPDCPEDVSMPTPEIRIFVSEH